MATHPAIAHSTFVIERTYRASPRAVFKAFADVDLKRQWFGCVDDWTVNEHTLDFRVGGREVWQGGPPSGPPHRNETVYHDIEANARIVWSYTMAVGDKRISASLATIELKRDGSRTRLTFTEQGAYFGGDADARDRERGTLDLLNSLGSFLNESDDATA